MLCSSQSHVKVFREQLNAIYKILRHQLSGTEHQSTKKQYLISKLTAI